MYYYSHLEDYIKNFYTNLHILNPLDLDIRRIAKELNIKIFYWNDGSQALFLKNSSFIFLDKNLSPEQQQQNFMHELCHVLLHTGDQMQMSPLFREFQEFKATNFTYHASVPTFMLEKMVFPDSEAKAVNMIQETFHVEYSFAKKRLDQYLRNRVVSLNAY